MKWFWNNTTQVAFGQGAVREYLSKFVTPKSKVLCTFGFGSIDKNGARADTQSALDALECDVRWEGGIPANPEYDRLLEIVSIARSFQPDLLLAVGGGSVLDGTKFISVAANLPPSADAWDTILVRWAFTGIPLKVGSVITLPATGSEWNNNFVVSRRSTGEKRGGGFPTTYPFFSLIDPLYTATLPAQQLRNGVYDAITHCLDGYLAPNPVPLMDSCYRCVVRELVAIGPDVVKEGASLELRERLIMAALFALNMAFTLGKRGCYAIHMIGHQLTAKYGIDHGATLAIVTKPCLEAQFEARKVGLAASAEDVFGIREGDLEARARAFIEELQKFIVKIGLPTKVSDWPGVVIGQNDVEELVQAVLSSCGGVVGFEGCYTEAIIRSVLQQTVV
jgi:alcohol dehydrogenase YqhD (iron-dependent ADH family)